MKVIVLSIWFCLIFIVVYTVGAGNNNYPRTLSGFKKSTHGVRSGDVILLDDHHIKVKDFYYDGSGPDVFFWVGRGNRPNKDGKQIQDERGTSDKLMGYQGKDIELELPNDITINDIDWLSVWCKKYETNFGHVVITKN